MNARQSLTGLLLITALSGIAVLAHRQVDAQADFQSQQRALVQAAARLPHQHGPWQLIAAQPLGHDTRAMLRCVLATERTYVDGQSGCVARVVILVGPAGPTSVHLPEYCYASRNFSPLEKASRLQLEPAGSPPAQRGCVWWQRFGQHGYRGDELQVAYAWNDGSGWHGARYPRVRYAARPLLCKLQVSIHAPEGGEPLARQRFLCLARHLVPDLQRAVVPALAAANGLSAPAADARGTGLLAACEPGTIVGSRTMPHRFPHRRPSGWSVGLEGQDR